MSRITKALLKTEVACCTVIRLTTSPSRDKLQVALNGMVRALGRLTEALQPKPKPTRPKRINGHRLKISATERALEVLESEWDPDPARSRIESSRCRALLLEIVKRAIHDWVLYRTHSELTKATYAREAYEWLFEEEEDHPNFKARVSDRLTVTSFVVICEFTDLRPEELRAHIRTLKVSDVMGTGRPAERRRRPSEEVSIEAHGLAGLSIESLEPSPNYKYTYLEQHYAPNQLGYL